MPLHHEHETEARDRDDPYHGRRRDRVTIVTLARPLSSWNTPKERHADILIIGLRVADKEILSAAAAISHIMVLAASK